MSNLVNLEKILEKKYNFHNMSSIRKRFKKVLPDSFVRIITGFFYGWHGNYSTWELASKKCSGYNENSILEKVKNSTYQVKNGIVPYERDSVLFDKIEFSYELSTSLMWVAAINKGNLKVLDYGGSLGSSYYQNKIFLDTLNTLSWCIIEQPNFVEVGNEFFADEKLHFFNSLEECLELHNVNIVILSSVLQYLENPYWVLNQINKANIKYVCIDRTPFIRGKDRITIQKVNPKIYEARYPCWFFNKLKFVNFFKNDYELIFEFDAIDNANIKSEFKGFLFKKKETIY